MQCTGNQFFAGSGRSCYQHRCWRLGSLLYHFEDTLHESTAMHNGSNTLGPPTASHIFLELDILLVKMQALLRLAHSQEDFIGTKRLGNIVVSSLLHTFNRRIDTAIGTHHDHRTAKLLLLLFFKKSQPVHFRHTDITEDQAVMSGFQTIKTLTTTECFGNHIAITLQNHSQHMPHRRFIIDYQNLTLFNCHDISRGEQGKVTVKHVP